MPSRLRCRENATLLLEKAKAVGDPKLNLGTGEALPIYPTGEIGAGQVQDKTMVALAELIAKVNDLIAGDLMPGDKLVYVNDVIKGKLMESEKLQEQAANNTKEQFAASPDLASEILSAVMDALTPLCQTDLQHLPLKV